MTTNNLRTRRDKALILVAYDSVCRRSKLVSIRIENIGQDVAGAPIQIRLRRSKMENNLNNVETKFIFLKEINEADLQDIINLRQLKSNNYLTPISPCLDAQLIYFKEYKTRRAKNSEIYYKIIDKSKLSQISGLVRLTEISNPNKFSWESLIVADGAPPYVSLDAMITIYRIGFETLNKTICGPWTIPINAKNVYSLHSKVGMAEEISRDESFYNMIVTKEAFNRRFQFFKKIGYGLYNLNQS